MVERLTSKPIQPRGITKPVGPFRVVWESNSIEEKSEIVSTLATMAEGTTLQEIQDRTAGGAGALGDLREWAERKYRMKGQVRDFPLWRFRRRQTGFFNPGVLSFHPNIVASYGR